MTAATPPPPRDGEVCAICGDTDWQPNGSMCDHDDRPAAPSPVDTTEPPAEPSDWERERRDSVPFLPPAETQQDDEHWPDAVLIEGDWISPRKEAHARDLTKSWADAAKDAGCPDRFVARMRTFVELHDRLHTESAALAARPSADRETLREGIRLGRKNAWDDGWDSAKRGEQRRNPYRDPR